LWLNCYWDIRDGREEVNGEKKLNSKKKPNTRVLEEKTSNMFWWESGGVIVGPIDALGKEFHTTEI